MTGIWILPTRMSGIWTWGTWAWGCTIFWPHTQMFIGTLQKGSLFIITYISYICILLYFSWYLIIFPIWYIKIHQGYALYSDIPIAHWPIQNLWLGNGTDSFFSIRGAIVASEWGLDFHLQKRLRHHNMLGQLGFQGWDQWELNGGSNRWSYGLFVPLISLAIFWRWDNHQSLGSSIKYPIVWGAIIRPWQPWKMYENVMSVVLNFHDSKSTFKRLMRVLTTYESWDLPSRVSA